VVGHRLRVSLLQDLETRVQDFFLTGENFRSAKSFMLHRMPGMAFDCHDRYASHDVIDGFWARL
jgi:hypothetical protein